MALEQSVLVRDSALQREAKVGKKPEGHGGLAGRRNVEGSERRRKRPRQSPEAASAAETIETPDSGGCGRCSPYSIEDDRGD